MSEKFITYFDEHVEVEGEKQQAEQLIFWTSNQHWYKNDNAKRVFEASSDLFMTFSRAILHMCDVGSSYNHRQFASLSAMTEWNFIKQIPQITFVVISQLPRKIFPQISTIFLLFFRRRIFADISLSSERCECDVKARKAARSDYLFYKPQHNW